MGNAAPDPRQTRLIFDVVEKFFRAKRLFLRQFEGYERKVLAYAAERQTDRRHLKLTSEEVATLLDFKELEELRDHVLFDLKELAHSLFRRVGATDPFDRYVSDIFHEISILKEEHYTVRTYGPQFESSADTEESLIILEEVHEYFPRRVHHVRRLFEKAEGRLLEVLPTFRENGIFVRSLALYGEDLLAGAYEGGLSELFGAMYPQAGAVAGYLDASRRFHEGGFDALAADMLGRAESELQREAVGKRARESAEREVSRLRRALSENDGRKRTASGRLAAASPAPAERAPERARTSGETA
ncbi:MAG: hypothetical protein L0216_15835 [Planctomycetales bacterium]|nr:hypothetical protein [Planctomycetales bacterium]